MLNHWYGLNVIIIFKKLIFSTTEQKNKLSQTLSLLKWNLWSSGRALGSWSEGRGFNPLPILDGSGVKATPESIPTPNSGSLHKIRKYR
jgi:hypothetical protein